MVNSLLEIITERGSQVLQAYRCPLWDWKEHGFSCGYIFCR